MNVSGEVVVAFGCGIVVDVVDEFAAVVGLVVLVVVVYPGHIVIV